MITKKNMRENQEIYRKNNDHKQKVPEIEKLNQILNDTLKNCVKKKVPKKRLRGINENVAIESIIELDRSIWISEKRYGNYVG